LAGGLRTALQHDCASPNTYGNTSTTRIYWVGKSDHVKPHEKIFIYAPFKIMYKLYNLPLTWRGVSARLLNMIVLVPTRTATQVFTGWVSWILLGPMKKPLYMPFS
jgi:hypothetical protein